MFDTGAAIPIISSKFMAQHNLPMITRDIPLRINGADGCPLSGAGEAFTHSLLLRYKQHYTMETFEVMPLESGTDIILPCWWMAKHQPNRFWGKPEEITLDSEFCRHNCTRAAAQEFSLTMDKDILHHYDATVIGSVASVNLDPAKVDPTTIVPEKFQQYIKVLGKELADKLPDHKPYDHAIDLKDGEQPPWGPMYPLNETELKALRDYLKEMLELGKIRPSKSPAAAPIIFVPKAHGRGLRLCVDYRGLNKVTIANRYPLPIMSKLQDRFRGAKIFTKIDRKNGYNLIRIKPGDEWKTAFKIRYRLYEYTVMPFGLSNAPATFQNMMNHIFRDLLDLGLIVYLDDILIYAETEEEHDRIIIEVLKRLAANGLAISQDKCFWSTTGVDFLGYVISKDGIEMAQDKVQCIRDWERPKGLRDVQSFIGFANFYRRFIEGFSKIAKPLSDSTKGSPNDWIWTDAMTKSFEKLKHCFTTAPILTHFDPHRECIVETDASDFALGSTLSQTAEDKKLHPNAFHSRKFSPGEINYEIHDEELLTVVDCFRAWRRYLEVSLHMVQVFTDHKNLEYFMTTKVLNRRQACWAQELASVDFKIFYRKGTSNGKPEALSRRPEYRPEKGGGGDQPIQTVLNEKHFGTISAISTGGEGIVFCCSAVQLAYLATSVSKWTKEFEEEIRQAGQQDAAYYQALEELSGSAQRTEGKEMILELQDGLLYRKGLLWVPEDA
jgi:hypothetical protein